MEVLVDKYSEYKYSGEQWIGNVPSHWEVRRLGSKYSERKTKVSDQDYPALSVTKNGILPQLANAAKTNDGDNRKLVKEGDFVINSRSDRKGSSGIAYQDGSVSLINIVIQPKNFAPKYAEFLLKSNAFIEEYYRVGHGIVADLWTTRYDEMKNIKIPIPSPSEQTAIANFLDRKTKQIDKAIAQKERLIELLKERKQIIIQNAVTRGLDENGKPRQKPERLPSGGLPEGWKDSGIEWIGEIPEHWEVKKLKYVVKIHKKIIGYEGPDVLSITQKGIKVKDISSGEGQLAMDYSKYQIVEKGDIAMNHMDLLTGYVDISKFDGVMSPDYRVFRTFLTEIEDPFLLLIFQMCYKNRVFYRYGQGVSKLGRWRLPAENFYNFSIAIPPYKEQWRIINQIELAEEKIENSIIKLEYQIEKLKEYKASLIDSAVTGKIKVPGV